MARGFGASERVSIEKPRTFLGKITSEIQKAASRVAELKNSGRSFDLDAALYALESAQIKMLNYESRRRGFWAAETRDWDLVKNFGMTESEAKHQMMFGNFILDRMEGIMKEVRAPGKMFRPAAFDQALKADKPATAESVLKNFSVWKNEKEGYERMERDGKFAKDLTTSAAREDVAKLSNDIFKVASSGNMGDKSQKAIEEASAKAFKSWTEKGVSRKIAANLLGMAQASASVRIEEADIRSKDVILQETGFKTGKNK